MQSNKDKIIVAHIDRQSAKKAEQFARGQRDAMQGISYRAKGYLWQQEAYNRGYLHGLWRKTCATGSI
jgi:hypothetical protein